MRRFINITIIVLLLLTVLVLANPDKDDFINWAIKEVEENSESEIEEFLGGVLGRPLLSMSTSREDYLLFSLFRINKTNDQGIYLGLLKYIFIKIK